jgi:hypothetical protein
MFRALCLATMVVLLPPNAGFADAKLDSDGNAALKYWQAFATLPTFNDAENKKLAEVMTTPLDDLARKIVTDADYSLRMMHYGAMQPRCDWGVGHEEGIFTRLPQANAARVLASLACLRARMRIEAGQSALAIDDIVSGIALGRHCSLTGTNLMLLVGYAIEHRMIDVLALELLKLDTKLIPDLERRLAALPAGMTLAEATASEQRSFLDWFVRTVKKANDKESLLAALAFVDNEPEGKPRSPGEKSRAFVEECGGTVEGVLRYSEETRASYGQVRQMLSLPLNQFEKEFEIEAKKRAGNPVFKVFFPAIVKVRRAKARMDVRQAMLSTALGVRQNGLDALKNHADPVVGGPFDYHQFDGGFELRSKFMERDDKPVTLTIGQLNK